MEQLKNISVSEAHLSAIQSLPSDIEKLINIYGTKGENWINDIINLLTVDESKKSIYVVIIPEILTAITISFLAFTKNFYVYNINLILFFCFVSVGSPVIQGYLIKTIPKSIKGIGVGLDMIVSTFLGKIPGPVIYGALEDKYLEENRALAWQICMCYFYLGVIIVFISTANISCKANFFLYNVSKIS